MVDEADSPVRAVVAGSSSHRFSWWWVFLVILVLVVGVVSLFVYQENVALKRALDRSSKGVSSPKPSSGSFSSDPVVPVELSSGFITSVLVEIDAPGYLHQSPLFEDPMINFVLGGEEFSAVIDGDDITTTTGLLDDADIQFETNEGTVDWALSQDDPYAAIGASIASGDIEIVKLVSDVELFSKGYRKLQESF